MATKTVSAPKTTSKSSVPAPKTSAPSVVDSRDYGKSVSYTPNNYSFRNSAPSTAPDSRDYGKSVSYTPSAQTSALYKNGSSSSALDSRDYGKSVSYTPNNYSFRPTGGGSGGGGINQAEVPTLSAFAATTPIPKYSPPPAFAAAPVQMESVQAPQTAVASAVSTSIPGTTSNPVPNPENEARIKYELGRSQQAYGEYKDAGRMDLANLAHQNANKLHAEAQANHIDLTPYAKTGFTQFYNKQGPAGAYDPSQQGKVQRTVPAPGGPSGNPVSDAQNGFQFNPTASPYPTKTPEQITAQIQAQVQAQIQSRKTLADQQKQGIQQSYDRMNATETDQRALENNQFERNNNPYSGGSDYRRAMLDRERNITDRQQNEDLMAKLGSVDKELYDYIQNASVEEQKQIMDMVNQERSYALQYQNQDFSQQKGTYDSNRNAFESDRTFNFTEKKDTRDFNAQQDAAKRDAAQKDLANEWAASESIGKVTAKLSKLTGIPSGTPTMEARKMATQQDQFNKNYQLDKDKAAFENKKYAASTGNTALDNKMAIWKATGSAPDGIPGVAKGTPLYDAVAARQDANGGTAAKAAKIPSSKAVVNEFAKIFRDQFNKEIKEVGGATESVQKVEKKLLTDNAFLDKLINDGKSLKDVIDGLYIARTGKTRSEFASWYKKNYGQDMPNP